MPDEAFLRKEFERQHAGRNLKRHWMRGTYVSAGIAALWNQHFRTAKWLSSRMTPQRLIVGIDPGDDDTLAVAVHLREGDVTKVLYSQRHPAKSGSIGAADTDMHFIRCQPPDPMKRTDFTLKTGDTVYSARWGGGKLALIIADIDWNLSSTAVRAETGSVFVLPVAGLSRTPKGQS